MNQFLKLWFRIPRPWILDKDFTILEQAREGASGYSFPSGHTQSAVGTFGSIGYTSRNRWVKIVGYFIAGFVAFSRMYIGVHTPLDVFVSIAVGITLIVLFKPLIVDGFEKTFKYILGFMVLLGVGFLAFVECYAFPADIDVHNLESGLKNAYTLLGSLVGLLIVYIADEKWLQFSTKAVWWAQILKVVGGLAVVLAVRSGLKTPLNAILGESVGRAARYMLIVIVAGVVWPLTFKLFQKLGVKKDGNIISK
jgi:undecaprenyl-diphosphatase